MATLSQFSDKQVLIIDDIPDVRTTLRAQVGSLNISNINVASSIKDALELIRSRKYDIILCDYYMGGATDGQQFLEFLRTANLISRGTLFIMITAETGYENVITAAECLPDDYLLKPFTAETLCGRIERMMERKARLAAIDKLQDKGAWPEIIVACDEIIAAKDKYLVDAMRIKGNALIMTQQYDEAADFYRHALSLRPMPWAKLGLAKALDAKGDKDAAQQTLTSLIGESPNLLSAYDLLGKVLTESGKTDQAMKVLENACTVAPNSLARHRNIAQIAESTGDFSRVEQALNTVIKKTKNSPLRDPKDYMQLGNAYTEMGTPDKALSLLEDAKTVFKGSGMDTRGLHAAEALALDKSGQHELAKIELRKALIGGEHKLPPAMAMTIAKACLTCDEPDMAMTILKTTLQNNPDSTQIQQSVEAVLKDHGGVEAAKELIERSAQEVVQLNNAAVAKAKAGFYGEAAEMLTEAALQLPNNVQVVANAALALMVDIFMNGMNQAKFAQARQFQASVIKINRKHPKLIEIDAIGKKVNSKYSLQTTP